MMKYPIITNKEDVFGFAREKARLQNKEACKKYQEKQRLEKIAMREALRIENLKHEKLNQEVENLKNLMKENFTKLTEDRISESFREEILRLKQEYGL